MESSTRVMSDEKHIVQNKIHHIWIGSLIKEKERDYAEIWSRVNDGYDMGKPKGRKYISSLWVDPNALMVGETKKEIVQWAEWKALQERGVTDVKTFDLKMIEFTFRDAFAKRVTFWASKQRFELEKSLKGVAASTLDFLRSEQISTLRAERLGTPANAELKTLLDRLGRDTKIIQARIRDGSYRDINTVLDHPDNALLKKAYLQELNLRQNMAAAADIGRVLVLRQEGGVYADLDLLPRFKSSAFIEIAQELEFEGYIMPEGISMRETDGVIRDWQVIPDRLLGAITDAVVLRLGLIQGYRATKSYEIKAEDLAEGQEITVAQQQRQLGLVTQVVDKILSKHYPGKFDCFHRLKDLDPPLGYGYSFYRKGSGDAVILKPNNQFIVSHDTSFIEGVYASLERNYTFLMDPIVAQMFRIWNASNPSEPLSLALKVAWFERFGTPLKNELAGAFAAYMADGIEPYAVSTVVISGPIVCDEVARSLLAQEEDFSDPRYLEQQDYNAQTSDGAESSWWVSSHRTAALRARQFPDAQPRPTLDRDEQQAWAEPVLRAAPSTDPDAGTMQYQQQFIIQVDGDDVSLHAAQALFGKHATQSTFIQARPDGLHFLFADPAAREAYMKFGPGQFFNVDGATRISLVGHGKVVDGAMTMGGKTASQFLSDLKRLLTVGAVPAGARLVINLVACDMDDMASAPAQTFAGQLVAGLPDLAEKLGLDRNLELHARPGAVSVDDEGRKSQSKIVYRYEDGKYVRQAPLDMAEVGPGSSRSDLRSLGLIATPAGQASPSEVKFDREIVLIWDEEIENMLAAAEYFNRNPGHSVYVDLSGEGRTVFLDPTTQRLMVREGYSALSRRDGTVGHVNMTLFGQSGGTIATPTFDGLTPRGLLDQLNPALSKVMQALDLGNAASELTITLEGTGLADPLLAENDGFLGKFASDIIYWVDLHVGTDRAVVLKHIDFEARAGHLQIDNTGEAAYSTVHGKILHGELALLYDAVHRAQFKYDEASHGYRRTAMSSDTLKDIGRRIVVLRNGPESDGRFSADLDRVTIEYLKLMRHSSGAPPLTPHHRSARQEMLAELDDILALRRERLDALSLITPPGDDYRLVPERVEKLSDGAGYRLGYARYTDAAGYAQDDANITWVATENDVFIRWLDKANELGSVLNDNLVHDRHPDAGEEFSFRSNEHINAAHTVSAAFLLQSLIGPQNALLFGKEDDAIAAIAGRQLDQMSTEEIEALRQRLPRLRAQIGVNYAQLTHGVLSDAYELTRAINVLRRTTPEADRVLGPASAFTTLGVAFDIANVVLASIEWADALTPSDKTRAGARLGVALVTSGMSIGALVGGLVARRAAGLGLAELAVPLGLSAEVLGVLSTPVAGLGMGVVDVIDAYDELAQKIDGVLHTLERAAKDATGPTLATHEGVIRFTDGLVMAGFDLLTGASIYGGVKIRALKRMNRFVAPDPAQALLDVYRPFLNGELGKHTEPADFSSAHTILLPSALARHYDYTLVASPGWRFSEAFPNLTVLEEAYPDKFYWWTYRQAAGIFGWDYSPSDLRTTYDSTPFDLRLDASDRNIVVPIVAQDAARSLLHYRLQGNGGRYSVALPMQPTDLHIQPSAHWSEYWSFDLSHAVYESSVQGQNIVHGAIRPDVFRTIALTKSALKIDGKTWASFDANMLHGASMFLTLKSDLYARLIFVGTSYVTMSNAQQLNPFVYLEYDTVEDLNKEDIRQLYATLARGGLTESMLRIETQDGSYGLVDFQNQHTLMTTYDTTTGMATLFVDGVAKLALPSLERFNIGSATNNGEPLIMASTLVDGHHEVLLAYQSGKLIPLAGQFDHKPLFDPKTGGFLVDFNAMPWLVELTSLGEVPLLSGDGQSVRVARDPADQTVRPIYYACKSRAFSIDVDIKRRRVVVVVNKTDLLTAKDLEPYQGMFESVDEIEFKFVDHSGAHSRLLVDANAPLFSNKAITLYCASSLDLVVNGAAMTWSLDGEDLRFTLPGTRGITWINALHGNHPMHTLNVNGTGTKRLLDALSDLDTTHRPAEAVTTAWSATPRPDAPRLAMPRSDKPRSHASRLAMSRSDEPRSDALRLASPAAVSASAPSGTERGRYSHERDRYSETIRDSVTNDAIYVKPYGSGSLDDGPVIMWLFDRSFIVPKGAGLKLFIDEDIAPAQPGDRIVRGALRASWVIDAGRVEVGVRDGRISDGVLYIEESDPFAFIEQMPRHGKALKTWLSLFSGRYIRVQGSDLRADLTLRAGAGMGLPSRYTHATDDWSMAFDWNLGYNEGTYTLRRMTGDVLDIGNLPLYSRFQRNCRVIVIDFDPSVPAPTTAVLDISREDLAYKPITLYTPETLELTIRGGRRDLRYEAEGGDIVVYEGSETRLVWKGVVAETSGHMLTIEYADAIMPASNTVSMASLAATRRANTDDAPVAASPVDPAQIWQKHAYGLSSALTAYAHAAPTGVGRPGNDPVPLRAGNLASPSV